MHERARASWFTIRCLATTRLGNPGERYTARNIIRVILVLSTRSSSTTGLESETVVRYTWPGKSCRSLIVLLWTTTRGMEEELCIIKAEVTQFLSTDSILTTM